jgi:hypothetical protein
MIGFFARPPRPAGARASCRARCGDLGVLGRLGEDRRDRLGEGVERLLRLGLRGLHEQRLVDQQREVDRRRVVAVVQEPLGQVQRPDPQLLFIGAPDSTNSCMHSSPKASGSRSPHRSRSRARR